MTPGQAPYAGSPSAAAVRVSDEERDRAVEMLQTAFAEGRIDHTELDRRIGDALGARDRAGLSHALRGLPLPPHSSATGDATRAVATPSGTAIRAMPSGDERALALLAHWLGPFTLFLGPAAIALTRGKTSAFVRQQAWEAANFQVTFLGATLVLGIATGVTLGLAGLLFVPLILGWLGLAGIGGLSALAGNRWRYPWNVRLLG